MCRFQEEISTRIQEKRALEEREAHQGEPTGSQVRGHSPLLSSSDGSPSGSDAWSHSGGQTVHVGRLDGWTHLPLLPHHFSLLLFFPFNTSTHQPPVFGHFHWIKLTVYLVACLSVYCRTLGYCAALVLLYKVVSTRTGWKKEPDSTIIHRSSLQEFLQITFCDRYGPNTWFCMSFPIYCNENIKITEKNPLKKKLRISNILPKYALFLNKYVHLHTSAMFEAQTQSEHLTPNH